jgi:hypothetical protein
MLTPCILTSLRVFEELFNTNVASCIVSKKCLIIVFSSLFASACYFHKIMLHPSLLFGCFQELHANC